MKLPTNIKASSKPEFINPVIGIAGQYSLDKSCTVPYFFANLEIARISDVIQTYDSVAPSLEQRWQLTELYQRQIDPDRVKRDLVRGYLNLPNKLKFFNSLVVALLPKNSDGVTVASFEDYLEVDPEVQGDQAGKDFWNGESGSTTKQTFGGVHLIKSDAWGLSYLTWDKKRVDAIAVDGQHRLKALTEWVRERPGLSEEEKKTGIPIIFLLLSEKAGYKHTGTQSIKKTSREIFTDLNKNARKVDLATQVILDDLSIEARCVRSLLTNSTNEDSPDRLPLSLVRWQDHNIKFDTDYYLNSVVGLHAVIDYLLDVSPPSADKALDIEVVKQYIDKLNKVFGIGRPPVLALPPGENRPEELSLSQYFTEKNIENDEVQVPFNSMPPEFLDLAVERFEQIWRPWIIRLLREHEPYKNIIDYAATNNLYTDVFCQWHAQPETHRKFLNRILADQFGQIDWEQEKLNKHRTAIEALKKCPIYNERWAFKNIFQKAYLKVVYGLANMDLKDEQKQKYASIDYLISFFNLLYKKDILCLNSVLDTLKTTSKDESQSGLDGLWLGISIHPSTKKIKATGAGCDLMQRVFRVWYHANVYLRLNEEELKKDGFSVTPKLLKKIESEISLNAEIYPNGKDDLEKLKNTLRSPQNARALFPDAKDDLKLKTAVGTRILNIIFTGLIVPESLAKNVKAIVAVEAN